MMTTKRFVFENVPDVEDKSDFLTDYIECILVREVKSLELLSAIPDKALVTFDDDHLDVDETNKILKKTPLEGACLRVVVAVQQNAVLLDRRQYSYFESYLESGVEGGKNIILKTFPVPGSELVAICISSDEALKSILRQKEIKIQSFYQNFHGHIQLDGRLLSEAIEDAGNRTVSSLKKMFTKKSVDPPQVHPSRPQVPPKPTSSGYPTKIPPNQLLSSKSLDEIGSKKQVKDSDEFQERDEGKEKIACTNNIDPRSSKLEEQPRMKLFRPRITPMHSPSRPVVTRSEEKRNDPRQDFLDLEEHIWNLIEGKLDTSNFCSWKYDRRRQILKFSSHDTEACKAAIDDLKSDIIEGSPLEIPENLRAMFVDLEKKDFFHACADDYFQRFAVQFFIQDNSIFFYGWDDEYIDNTKAEVRQRFMYSEEIDNENGMDVDHLRHKKKDLESDFMVSISWTDIQASKVRIQGVYDDISFVKESLEEAMRKYKNTTACFEFSQIHTSYIKKHCQHILGALLQKVKVSFKGLKDEKYVIEYVGKIDDINIVSKGLEEIRDKIKIESIDVSKDLDSEVGGLLTKAIVHQKPNDAFTIMQNLFEIDTTCCIINDIMKQETPSSQKPEQKICKKETTQFKGKQPILLQISPYLEVKVKARGNIVKEKAEVLVCPLHESGLLKKLKISQAFLRKDPSLQETLEKLDFTSSRVQLCKMTSQDDGSLTDVAFVSLSAWKEDTPEDYLQQLLTETLVKVSELGAKTVAFPPIGLGVILKYPADAIAKQFFSAIKDYNEKTSARGTLNVIEILACDADLHKKLQAELWRFQYPSEGKRRELEEIEEEIKQEHLPPHIVTIKIIHGQDDKMLAPLWKENFLSYIVDDEYFLNLSYMPEHLNRKLKKQMRKLVIDMEKTETDSGELVFKFRGLHEDILKIKAFIADQVCKDVAKLEHILSEHHPPRGTLEFINYAASIEETAPPYWTHQTKKILGENNFREVEVDLKTAEAIKELFLSTYDSSLAGHGNDAKSIPKQATVEFVDVKRIENIKTFQQYSQARKRVFEKKLHEKELCKSLSDISKRGQGSLLEPYMSASMKENLCHEINECYLLHGTKPNIVATIKSNGCDPNVASEKAMFGRGVYAAECSTKCDQYSDDPQNRLPPGSIHYAFLLRMLLGDIFVCDDTHPTVQSRDCAKLSRPPCKSCLQDRCYCKSSHFYDSVVGEGKWLFREFVVYRDYLCYPEYIISYKRV